MRLFPLNTKRTCQGVNVQPRLCWRAQRNRAHHQNADACIIISVMSPSASCLKRAVVNPNRLAACRRISYSPDLTVVSACIYLHTSAFSFVPYTCLTSSCLRRGLRAATEIPGGWEKTIPNATLSPPELVSRFGLAVRR